MNVLTVNIPLTYGRSIVSLQKRRYTSTNCELRKQIGVETHFEVWLLVMQIKDAQETVAIQHSRPADQIISITFTPRTNHDVLLPRM